MIGHFQTLLAMALIHPGRRLSELPLLSGPEHAQIAREWNDTAALLSEPASLPEMFEIQVRKIPGEPAVVCEGAATTYGELDTRANRLARHLRRLGIVPESLVGVLLERTPAMPAPLLGIGRPARRERLGRVPRSLGLGESVAKLLVDLEAEEEESPEPVRVGHRAAGALIDPPGGLAHSFESGPGVGLRQ